MGQVERFASQERLFRRVKKVLVAFSGGPDSLALLLVLKELGARHGFDVAAAHFDHQLRPESREEMERARELCASLGIECISGEGDVPKLAAERRMGTEEAARRMRYQFLGFVAGRENASCVATGHTAGDQVETVLMRILRGTGVRGLRGMEPSAVLPDAPAHRVVRPLLCLGRADTEALCREAGLEPVRDATNADRAYTRNLVRAETLAALEAVNPSIGKALLGLAESARQLFAPIERSALETQPESRGPYGAIFATPALLQLETEALTLVVEREASVFHAVAAVNRTRLRNLRDVLRSGSGSVRFGEAEVEASGGMTRIGPVLSGPEPFQPAVLNVPGLTAAGPWMVEVATSPLPAREGAWIGSFGGDLAEGALRARPLQRGDRLKVPGGSRAVQDLLVNAHLPRWERGELVAIADGSGVLLLGAAPERLAPPAQGDDALFVRLSPRGG